MSDYNPLRDPVVRNLMSLTDTEMASRRPELRAMALSRMEMLWRACEPHVTGLDAKGNPFYPDYRYVDLAMRIMDRQIRLLGVLKPDEPEQETVVQGRDPNAVKASRDLDEIETRLRARGELGA